MVRALTTSTWQSAKGLPSPNQNRFCSESRPSTSSTTPNSVARHRSTATSAAQPSATPSAQLPHASCKAQQNSLFDCDQRKHPINKHHPNKVHKSRSDRPTRSGPVRQDVSPISLTAKAVMSDMGEIQSPNSQSLIHSLNQLIHPRHRRHTSFRSTNHRKATLATQPRQIRQRLCQRRRQRSKLIPPQPNHTLIHRIPSQRHGLEPSRGSIVPNHTNLDGP